MRLSATVQGAEARAILELALDLGISFFDTADAYADGENEKLIGDVLGRKWDRIVVATKFGNLRRSGSDRKVDGRPAYVLSACEASLRRLGTDIIDLYYLHRVDPLVPIEETVGAMKLMVEQGKVRYLGLSEASPETIRRAHATHPITAVQSEYSLWSREPETAVLATCQALGIGFVSYSPLGKGLLTGTITEESALATDDPRRQQPRFKKENLARNLATLGPLRAIAERLSVTPAQVALAWVLAQGNKIVPIPGTTQRRYLMANASAVDLSLTAGDLDLLSRAFPEGAVAGKRNNDDALRLMNG
jgi:aryl-alcohol dehydrogenase-like predicted oxidoreductase